jgi:excisionase family DNA binding protein
MAANTTQTPAQPKRRRLGKKPDAATVLKCSLDTLDRFIRRGAIPIVRLPSGRVRIDLDELDRLIDEEWKERR